MGSDRDQFTRRTEVEQRTLTFLEEGSLSTDLFRSAHFRGSWDDFSQYTNKEFFHVLWAFSFSSFGSLEEIQYITVVYSS